MTSPDRLDPLSLAGSFACLEADVLLGLTLPAGRSQRITLGTERPQAARAATGPDGEHHSRDEASAGEPHAEAAPAAATGIDSSSPGRRARPGAGRARARRRPSQGAQVTTPTSTSFLAAHRYDHDRVEIDTRAALTPLPVQRRDLAIVRDVWRYKLLATAQLQELWWPGRSQRAAQKRLTRLFQAALLERFRPVTRRGSYPWIY
jgi:hypothetical protein